MISYLSRVVDMVYVCRFHMILLLEIADGAKVVMASDGWGVWRYCVGDMGSWAFGGVGWQRIAFITHLEKCFMHGCTT